MKDLIKRDIKNHVELNSVMSYNGETVQKFRFEKYNSKSDQILVRNTETLEYKVVTRGALNCQIRTDRVAMKRKKVQPFLTIT